MSITENQIDVLKSGLGLKYQAKLKNVRIRSTKKLIPVIGLVNLITAALLLWMYAESGNVLGKTLWVGALGLVLIHSGFSWAKNNRHKQLYLKGKTAYESEIKRSLFPVHFSAFMLGLVWGSAGPLFSMLGSAELKTPLAIALSTTLISGGCLFAAIPRAVLAFILPVVFGSIYALWALPPSNSTFFMYIILVLIALGVFVAISIYAKLLTHSVIKGEKEKEQTAKTSMLLSELQQASSNWVWETDPAGQLTRFPPEMLPKDVDLHSIRLVEYLNRIASIKGTQLQELEKALENNEPFKDIILCTNRGMGEMWLRLSGHPVVESNGEVIGFVGTGFDITAEKLAEDRIDTLAHSDTLTGLMNRGSFTERLSKSVANMERYGRPFTILYLDLDGFKLINDTRGHLAGDRLLAEASERLEDEVREGDCIARLGGDEFAILMDNQGDAGAAARLAARLIGEIGKPYYLDNEELRIGLSIGIALAPLNGTRPDQLIRNADLALYRAKADGRGVFRFFENGMDSELREKRMLEAELSDAVKNDELVLHFQPLVDAKTREIAGMESLVRWEHPIRGLLSPIEFVEMAEQSHLISELGHWILKKACKTALNWPEHTFVAVNLSGQHFMREDIVAEVDQILKETGLPASRLELEITESLLINNSKEVISKLENLKALGVSVAMDDFGTGYSSLSYLMNVPFDKLKIDKSFIDKVPDNEAGKKIVRMITTLARELDMKVTAEGVEAEEQAKYLSSIGCDMLQGYLFAKPMNEEKLPAYFLKSAKKFSLRRGNKRLSKKKVA